MPLAFPSHQGLVLPLARRWPERFDALALCVGAAMPDLVDGVVGLWRGHLGQSYGHSLMGVIVFCGPLGLLLTWLLATLAPRLGTGRRRLVLWSQSLLAGAASHLLFDALSHDGCLWFYPWRARTRFFGPWWSGAWFHIPLPFYERLYAFAPHTVVWCILTVLGAWGFWRYIRWRRR
jgi:hypothetical protein